jgi:hypothetical protein
MAWDAFHISGDDFVGIFHIDSSYDPALGGYAWGVGLSARANGRGGEGVGDALGTLSLQSVTLPNGTPLDISFVSGLTLTAVPEPSSVVLLGTLGCVAMLNRRRRHNDEQ